MRRRANAATARVHAMAGTWDGEQWMWGGPGAKPNALARCGGKGADNFSEVARVKLNAFLSQLQRPCLNFDTALLEFGDA